MNRISLLIFSIALLAGSGCGHLSWISGSGEQGGQNWQRVQLTAVHAPGSPSLYQKPHYTVISGKDSKGSFNYVSKGPYPGLSHH